MTLLVLLVKHTGVRKCIKVRMAGMGSLAVGNLKAYYGYEEEQKAWIHNDINRRPNVHHLKVVDTDKGREIIAYAKWEIHEQSQPDSGNIPRPRARVIDKKDRYGSLSEDVCAYVRGFESGPSGVPHIYLVKLVTSPQHQ